MIKYREENHEVNQCLFLVSCVFWLEEAMQFCPDS